MPDITFEEEVIAAAITIALLILIYTLLTNTTFNRSRAVSLL